MALTSLFDKAETGSGVILLILIFGGLPAMFLTVHYFIDSTLSIETEYMVVCLILFYSSSYHYG